MDLKFALFLVHLYSLVILNEMAYAEPLLDINISEIPQKVVNFSCTWERLQHFHCQWRHLVEYRNSSHISVTFEWKRGYSSIYNNCSIVKDLTRCDDIPNISIISNTFRVNVTNTETGTRSTTVVKVEFPREMCGKPGKMTELKAVKINETDALLQWLSEPGDLEYTIKQNCSDGESTNHYNSRSTDIESVRNGYYKSLKKIVIRGILPNSTCLFEVRARYCSFFDVTEPVGIPSDPASITLQS